MRFVPLLVGLALAGSQVASAQGASQPVAAFELYVDEVYNKRTGGEIEVSVAFRDPLTRDINPTLRVTEGQRVSIRLINRTQRPRSFAVMGVGGATPPQVAAGARATVEFQAPARGAYIYHDPGQAGLPETRSLFGDLIVAPRPSR
jgi:FtsP/CotA-like multicopper oxidase with cupredoxin domain